MAEYIDRDALLEKLANSLETWAKNIENICNWWPHAVRIKDSIVAEIKRQPPADVVEVKHGRWRWEGKFKACSNCGSHVEWNETLGANFWKFCPYCGAKMDGGKENG